MKSNFVALMKKLKPLYVVAFLLITFISLSLVSSIIPSKGWAINGVKIRFLTWDKVMHPKVKKKKDIAKIITNVDTLIVETKQDSLIQHSNVKGSLGNPSGGKIISESSTQIHFSEIGLSKIHDFFAKLDNISSTKEKIHILHYGDSQIEGDRMTAYIRQRLQEQFGGFGPGLIPTINVYNTMSFKQNYSENFRRFTVFGGDKLKSRKYGALGSAGRFTKEYNDSIERSLKKSIEEAWIEIEPSKSAYSRSRNYNNVNLYYTSCNSPCSIKVLQNNVLIHEDSLISDGKYHVLPLSFENSAGKLKYVFSSAISPTILGFTLEGDFGVQVDNIAMRGSSGTFMGNLDQTLLSKMYQDLDAELIFMQFGGNSVPYFKDSSSVRNYARQFKGQLQALKRLRPSASIIVIGPSDMSVFTDGFYETYPLLPALVSSMKKAALDVGAGYWDLFSAMGGLNSMPSWVEKGLAGKDYIHFSPRGASIASQLFYEAFAAEYAKWKNP
jgi:lysophospholipase L1-like esterase